MNSITELPSHIDVLREGTTESIRRSLSSRKADNLDKKIWPSENLLIDKLLSRFDEIECFCLQ